MTIETISQLDKLFHLTQGPYKAFLYDCDGTLADNMGAHKEAFVKTALEFAIQLDDAIIDELAGWPTIVIANEIIKRYGVHFDPETFARRKSTVFVEEYINKTLPIYFVVEHLKRSADGVKIGVVSGGSRSTVSKTLQLIDVCQHVDVLVCAGDTTRGKPYPDPFIRAAELLHVSPQECLVFEDGDAGVQAAREAGMKWIRVDKI